MGDVRWHAFCDNSIAVNLADIFNCRQSFLILQTTERVQTGMMMLKRGEASSDTPNSHPLSDQVVLVLEGFLEVEVENEMCTIPPGASLLIPAGKKHRLSNGGGRTAFAFTTYSPPAYPAEDHD